jgi:hypothetical protein
MVKHIVYYREGGWCLFSKVVRHVKFVFEVACTKSTAPLPFDLH